MTNGELEESDPTDGSVVTAERIKHAWTSADQRGEKHRGPAERCFVDGKAECTCITERRKML